MLDRVTIYDFIIRFIENIFINSVEELKSCFPSECTIGRNWDPIDHWKKDLYVSPL